MAYIHLIQCLGLWQILTSRKELFLAFTPILIFESMLCAWYHFFQANSILSPYKTIQKILCGIIGNSLLWFIIFLFWVIFVFDHMHQSPGLQWYGPQFFLLSIMLWRSMTWITLIGIMIWAGLYYWFCVKWRTFRVALSILPYFGITLLLFMHQFLLGGMGGMSWHKPDNQPSVKTILDIQSLKYDIHHMTNPYRMLSPSGSNRYAPKESVTLRYHPRGVIVDTENNAFFALLGGTYFVKPKSSPIIVRKDLATGDLTYLFSTQNVRRVEKNGSSIIMAPWGHKYIYEISKKDLSVLREIHHQTPRGFYWEPMDVFRDIHGHRLYIGNDIYPAILTYDLKSGKLIHILDLPKEQLVGIGGYASAIVQDSMTRRLYFVGIPGQSTLFEMNPDTFKVTRHLDLDDIMPTGLIIDPDDRALYYQSGFYNTLYKINIDSFTVERTYSSEFHSRRMRLDKKRHVIYILGYVSGTVFPIDLNTGKRQWQIHVGGRPHGMILQNDALWVNSMAGAFMIDLKTAWNEE